MFDFSSYNETIQFILMSITIFGCIAILAHGIHFLLECFAFLFLDTIIGYCIIFFILVFNFVLSFFQSAATY